MRACLSVVRLAFSSSGCWGLVGGIWVLRCHNTAFVVFSRFGTCLERAGFLWVLKDAREWGLSLRWLLAGRAMCFWVRHGGGGRVSH